jgi:hypothetical protein
MMSFMLCPFYPRERGPGTLWIGGWVGLRTNLDGLERRRTIPLPELELRPLCCPSNKIIFLKKFSL